MTKYEKNHRDETTNFQTFEGVIKLVLSENHAEVVDGAGVELHPEHHVPGGVSVPLVVTLQLREGKEGEPGCERLPRAIVKEDLVALLFKPYQDVSLQKQAGFNGDADAGVAVSLHVAVATTAIINYSSSQSKIPKNYTKLNWN